MSDQKRSMMRFGLITLLFPALALLISGLRQSAAQALPTATAPGAYVSVGGTYSVFNIPYGQSVLGGAGVYADINFRRQIGLEAEARWSNQGQVANVHQTTYLIGPRIQFQRGNLSPYAKGLVGQGDFNLPYNYGTVGSLVLAPGAGLDFNVGDRLKLRLVDFEYQLWQNFPYGNYSPYGISFGLSWRVSRSSDLPTHLRR